MQKLNNYYQPNYQKVLLLLHTKYIWAPHESHYLIFKKIPSTKRGLGTGHASHRVRDMIHNN